MRNRALLAVFFIAVAISLVLSGCGGNKGDGHLPTEATDIFESFSEGESFKTKAKEEAPATINNDVSSATAENKTSGNGGITARNAVTSAANHGKTSNRATTEKHSTTTTAVVSQATRQSVPAQNKSGLSDDASQLVVSKAEATSGKKVDVPIEIKNNPGIAGAIIEVSFDERLTLVSAKEGDAFASLDYTKPGKYSNPCKFSWDSESGMSVSDGTVVILTFSIPDNIKSGTTLEVNCKYRPGDIYDEDLEDVHLETVNGILTVK